MARWVYSWFWNSLYMYVFVLGWKVTTVCSTDSTWQCHRKPFTCETHSSAQSQVPLNLFTTSLYFGFSSYILLRSYATHSGAITFRQSAHKLQLGTLIQLAAGSWSHRWKPSNRVANQLSRESTFVRYSYQGEIWFSRLSIFNCKKCIIAQLGLRFRDFSSLGMWNQFANPHQDL